MSRRSPAPMSCGGDEDGAGDPPPRGVDPAASVVPPDTLQAYRESDYHVASMPPLVLRVDRASDGLHALHAAHRVTSSAFVTAYNPLGRPGEPEDNRRRQAQFVEALGRSGRVTIAGLGRHPTNGWPGEPSVLILGLDRAGAMALGTRFGQNAVIWCGVDAVPRLLLLR